MEAIESPLMCYTMRFEPGADLREGLLTFAEKNDLSAAFIVTCVGSVTKAILRMANSQTVSTCDFANQCAPCVAFYPNPIRTHCWFDWTFHMPWDLRASSQILQKWKCGTRVNNKKSEFSSFFFFNFNIVSKRQSKLLPFQHGGKHPTMRGNNRWRWN